MRSQSILAALLTALVLVSSPGSSRAEPATPEQAAADEAARQAALAPFVGGWNKHGYSLTIAADGSAEATWRTYRFCGDRGVTPPCDDPSRPETFNGGHMRMRFDRVEGNSAYGTVIETNAPTAMLMPPYPVVLELHSNGTALFLQGRQTTIPAGERAPLDGITFCGTLEAWQAGWCGA